jgi:hypothetical protein
MVRAATTSAIGKPASLTIRERTTAGATVKVWASADLALTSSFKELRVAATPAPGNRLEIYVLQRQAVAGDAFFADALSLVATTSTTPPPPPPPTTLRGTGWTGSSSLTTYPKTGAVTTCASGETGCIVDLDVADSHGATPAAKFQYALSLLATKSRVLLRNNTGAPVVVSAPIIRSSTWGSRKQVFAYGTQRIKVDLRNVASAPDGPVWFRSGGWEHWKGFEFTGGRAALGYSVIHVQNSHNTKLEDLWIDRNPMGDGMYLESSNDVVVQDVLYWHNGALSDASTNAGDGFTSGGTPPGLRNVFVRCVAIDAPDDGFDMFYGEKVQIIDSVSLRAGYFWDGSSAADGSGYKLGGDAGTRGETRGGTILIGSVAALSRATNISHWQAVGKARTLVHNTAYASRGHNFGVIPIAGEKVTSNLSHAGATRADWATTGSWNHWNGGSDPRFGDAANGDLSLMPGSPALGAGEGGSNQGASVIALELARTYWTLR